jgi:BirA family biotin operon repressor/biotin-[acetyl-CoA-carboxylase] ligase
MESDFREYWLDNNKIKDRLNSKTIGKNILVYNAVTSTNTVANEIAKSGPEEGAVVIAQTQKVGYGRLRRAWFSPPKGLWFSMILRPSISPMKAPFITLLAGASVARVLRNSCNIDATLKWPNDVLVKGKKICGILTEMRTDGNVIDFVVLGIGLNGDFDVAQLPEDIRNSSTTLRHELEGSIDLERIFTQILSTIDDYYQDLQEKKFEKILNMWREYQDTLGRNVRIETQKESIEGMALDLDDTGALLVKTEGNELRKIIAGDCIHLTASGGTH